MFSTIPNRTLLVLLACTAFLVTADARAAADLKIEFVAPLNLANNEAPAGSDMTLSLKVTNTSSSETSPAVRLSIFKYDHTCSGYPKNQPLRNGATYADVGALAPGASSDVLSFVDNTTDVPANAASVTYCYKTGLKTSSGGYYSDPNNANHVLSKAIKYVPGSAATNSTPLALSVSNLRTAPTSCGPGQHWVEATINSTQIIRADVRVEGIGASPIVKQSSLQAGNNTVRVGVTYPEARSYNVKLTASATPPGGSLVSANQQVSVTIPKCRGTIAVTAPAAGESIPAGSTYTVRWSTKNVPPGERVTIRVYNGSSWPDVATLTPNDGSEQVTMPNVALTNARVSIFAEKVAAMGYSREFRLAATTGGGGSTSPGTITVIQPAGGETTQPGASVHVRWTNSGNTGDQVKIRLLRGTTVLSDLTSIIENDGNQSVIIPANTEATSDARIGVISVTNVVGRSNPFTIGTPASAASITVTGPAAGAQLSAGSATNVTWSTSGNTGSTVTLRISINGGTYRDLKTNVPNDGSEQVTLPAIFNYSANQGEIVSTSNAKIMVISPSAMGQSGQFSIKVPALSFRTHLYNKITTDCAMCHPNSGSSMIHPQKARASNDAASTVDETVAPVIPFSTAITAIEMLSRFKEVKAASGAYGRALGKIYVVPSNPDNSGLHWKAQDSTSPIFEENMTIDGVVLKVQDWITLWIKQGAED